ncbi:MAG: CoA transferase [Acidisphaera sp.]|nr:CoA transferase [Acidisphaera sp.]
MGPSCGLVLADLGADVLRIEPPEGERTRRLQGFGIGFFGAFNRNKRSVALDLKHPAGLAAARRLLARADVLVENFGPGTMQRLGLDWESAEKLNPRLVYCALKGYLPGPYEDLPALDEVVQMQAGLAYMTGPPGRPLRAGASVIDIFGGVFGVVGILAALRERDRTGRGGIVHSALFEATAFLVSQHMAAAALTGAPPPPMPARVSSWPVYDVFATADAPVFVGVTSAAHWQRFCAAFDVGALRDDPALATYEGLFRERARVVPALAALLAPLPSAEIIARCRRARIPCAPVAQPADLFDDPHLLAAGALLDVALSPSVRARLPGLPLRLGDAPLPLRRQPPEAGAHTREVLTEAGYAEAELAELAREGAIGLGR